MTRQDIHALRTVPIDKIGMILYSAVTDLTIMVDNGLLGTNQLEAPIDDAVAQFLGDATPV